MANDYSQFGLDTEKRSHDPGKKQREWWCLWCINYVKRGFYLCFSNWCICEHCTIDLLDKWRSGEITPIADQTCFKCSSNGKDCFQTNEDLSTVLYICTDCLKWSEETLFSDDSPPVQRFLFHN